MKCPKCGNLMTKIKIIDTGNYIKRKLECKHCHIKAMTYEFLSEDIPSGFLERGSRVLIGDNDKDIVPAVYLTSCNSLYPNIAIDDEGELMGRRIIQIKWGVDQL